MSSRRLGLSVEVGDLRHQAVRAAFGGCAVVAHQEDQRVVEHAARTEVVEEPADLGVGVLDERRIHLHLAGVHPTLVVGQLVPRPDTLVARRQGRCPPAPRRVRSGGRTSRRGSRPSRRRTRRGSARCTPRRMVRRVRRPGREMEEERSGRIDRLVFVEPGDRPVGEVGGEVIVVAAESVTGGSTRWLSSHRSGSTGRSRRGGSRSSGRNPVRAASGRTGPVGPLCSSGVRCHLPTQ